MKIVTENGIRTIVFRDKPGFRFSASMGPRVVIYDGSEPQGVFQENYTRTSTLLKVWITAVSGSEFAASLGERSSWHIVSRDERFITLHIIIGRLFALNLQANINENEFETRINQTLKIPTIEQAKRWLERNRFTGANAYSKDDEPGWNVAGHPTRRLIGLPQEAQELHDELWGTVIGRLIAEYPNIDRSSLYGEENFQFIEAFIKESKQKQ